MSLQRVTFCGRIENVGLQKDGSRPHAGWSQQEMESASHKTEYLYLATTDLPRDSSLTGLQTVASTSRAPTSRTLSSRKLSKRSDRTPPYHSPSYPRSPHWPHDPMDEAASGINNHVLNKHCTTSGGHDDANNLVALRIPL